MIPEFGALLSMMVFPSDMRAALTNEKNIFLATVEMGYMACLFCLLYKFTTLTPVCQYDSTVLHKK